MIKRKASFLLLFILFSALGFAQSNQEACEISCPKAIKKSSDLPEDKVLLVTSNCTFKKYNFTLYTRWGEVMFHSEDPDDHFQATEEQQGTYYWTLKAVYTDGEKIEKSGFVNISN